MRSMSLVAASNGSTEWLEVVGQSCHERQRPARPARRSPAIFYFREGPAAAQSLDPAKAPPGMGQDGRSRVVLLRDDLENSC